MLAAVLSGYAAALGYSTVMPKVGSQYTVVDARARGPWISPATWLRTAREVTDAVWHPRSEAGFAWCTLHFDATILFAERSAHGNGIISVTSHGPWRCLMFNTGNDPEWSHGNEQGIACFERRGLRSVPMPQVLGFQYLRVMAAAAVGFGQLQPVAQQRALCIGLGSGALPGFIAHHFEQIDVSVVEIDPVVVRAAREELLCDFVEVSKDEVTSTPDTAGGDIRGAARKASVAPYRVAVDDAGELVRRKARAHKVAEAEKDETMRTQMIGAGLGGMTAREVEQRVAAIDTGGLSAILLDAFDARGETPDHLLQPPFLCDCHDALMPGGVLVINVFNGVEGSEARRKVSLLACRLASAVGQVYTLPVPTQEQSLVLVARRGAELPRPGRRDLQDAAQRAWAAAGLARGDAARLVRALLWVETPEQTEGLVSELHPPRRAWRFGPQPLKSLRTGSSASPLWMRDTE